MSRTQTGRTGSSPEKRSKAPRKAKSETSRATTTTGAKRSAPARSAAVAKPDTGHGYVCVYPLSDGTSWLHKDVGLLEPGTYAALLGWQEISEELEISGSELSRLALIDGAPIPYAVVGDKLLYRQHDAASFYKVVFRDCMYGDIRAFLRTDGFQGQCTFRTIVRVIEVHGGEYPASELSACNDPDAWVDVYPDNGTWTLESIPVGVDLPYERISLGEAATRIQLDAETFVWWAYEAQVPIPVLRVGKYILFGQVDDFANAAGSAIDLCAIHSGHNDVC